MKWSRNSSEQRELQRLEHARRHARKTLESLPLGSRRPAFALYAAAPAERLFRWYDARPDQERRPYSLTWRPVLGTIWSHLEGDESAYARISHALGEFYLSPYSNNGYQGPDDIDQDEAAATCCAALCVIHGLVDFALWSASRATDNLYQWYGNDEMPWQSEVSKELARQESDLAMIAAAARTNPHLNQGAPTDLIDRLRDS